MTTGTPPADGMPVVVNGRFLAQTITGVQRFALEITRHLAQLLPLEVIAPPLPVDAPPIDGAAVTVAGRGSGHFWEQVSLPAVLRRRGTPLLLNLASTGPLRHPRHISTHHDITYVRHPESFSRAFRAQYRLVVPPLLRRAERVLTVSEFSRQELQAHFALPGERIDVVPNAVAACFRGPGPVYEADAPYLLAVSSPNAHKNFSRLVEAFHHARRARIRRLLIVGEQARAFRGMRAVDTPEVTWLGRVSDDELASLYRGAAAFAFPSLYEGFGLPPLEAQSCGAPVLAARAASMPEVLRDSALYFDPSSVASIARAIETIDADPAVALRLIESGYRNAQRFSWHESAATVADIVRGVSA